MDKPFDFEYDIKILAAERGAISQLRAAIVAQEEELAQTFEYKRLQYMKEQLNVNEYEAKKHEDAIKRIAVDEFDGENKQPHPAIQIKTFTVVSYDDDVMKAWAIEHNHPAMLKLDKVAANKVAKGPTAPEFVSIKTEDRAQIKTDLSDYLLTE